MIQSYTIKVVFDDELLIEIIVLNDKDVYVVLAARKSFAVTFFNSYKKILSAIRKKRFYHYVLPDE